MALVLGAALAGAAFAATTEQTVMFSQAQFDQLDFLLGDWRGTAPDGSVFFERYQRGEANQLLSLRFATAQFEDASDGSTLVWIDGRVEARWGEFTWQASEIGPALACFEPVNAPSAFCWQAEGADRLAVTQRWTDPDGKPQSVRIELTRVSSPP